MTEPPLPDLPPINVEERLELVSRTLQRSVSDLDLVMRQLQDLEQLTRKLLTFREPPNNEEPR